MQNWLLQSLISARRLAGRARIAPVGLAALLFSTMAAAQTGESSEVGGEG